MKALLDGDIFAYRNCVGQDDAPVDALIHNMNEAVYRCLQAVAATEYIIFLSGGENYRYTIDPTYKANRTGPDPVHREALKAALVTEWGARLTDGIEADDALGIEQSLSEDFTTTICSIDKDLKQIRGYHYNFVKDEHDIVTPLDGLRVFYRQLLTGDRADNIPGVGGIGDVKSKRLIDHLQTEQEMFETVEPFFSDHETLLRKGKLLWIHKKENDWWEIPTFRDDPNENQN